VQGALRVDAASVLYVDDGGRRWRLPRGDAAFVREWPRLLMLDRALLESEFARRKGVSSMRDDLAAFMADLARDIEVGAFGAPVSVGAVPGFDGTAVDGATEGKSSDARPTRRR
jgi:hypothetical protein